MMNKRVHILFDEKDYVSLVKIAKGEDLSVGELVRRAVKGKYLSGREAELQSRREAFIDLKKWQNKIGISKEKIDYKELIDYGRKW